MLKKTKITDANFIIPKDNKLFQQADYKITFLKRICDHYKLRKSGRKNVLEERIRDYLLQNFNAICIQRKWKKYILQQYNNLKGPARLHRRLCMNATDFFTLERVENISHSQFYSFSDDKHIYGFDIVSIYTLFSKRGPFITNPYNRQEFPKSTYDNVCRSIRLSKFCGDELSINLVEPSNISIKKQIELKSIELFQKIDELGNYTNPLWFTSLGRVGSIQLIRALVDIWRYRAQLTIEIKCEICPPTGDPFHGINLEALINKPVCDLKLSALKMMQRLVSLGINESSKALGCNYVLCALTLVNTDAAMNLPWLYQSVAP